MVALVDHTKAIVKNGQPKSVPLFIALGEQGIEIFRKIFENNNEKLNEKFFTNDLIRMLWPRFVSESTKGHVFGKADPNERIRTTYTYLTDYIGKEFGLALPLWWVEEFNM
jgi:hypothetical protein